MAPSLSWLSTLKSTQLKALATATGLNYSGTKPFLTSALLAHLPHGHFTHHDTNKPTTTSSKARTQPYDIISIDMGIRNLAYCRLTSPSTNKPNIPAITQWARVEISKKISDSTDPDEPPVKEAFDPLTYSAHAYTLISTLLSTPPLPTQILIERQRFRSMGGSSVQEWTLRVNMFEAMLYATLKTFNEMGRWRGSVHPVAPAKVSKFWLGEKEGADVEGKGSKNVKTKTAKIALVGEWLGRRGGGRVFELEGEGERMARGYLRKREGKGRRGEKGEEVGKLDDLADCLLQGMAWVKWEQNRRLILEEGVDALEGMGEV